MWVLAFRNLNYSQQNTTSAIEGYHGALKQLDLNSSRKRLVGRRLDWLVEILLTVTEARYRIRHQHHRAGYVRNTKAIAAVTATIEAARSVEWARVTLVDSATGSADVSSPTFAPGYMVTDALTANPMCSCPCGVRGAICKHIVTVLRVLGKKETHILKAWGTLRGTNAGDKLVAGWTAAATPAAGGGGTGQGGGAEQAGGAAIVPRRPGGGNQRQLAVTAGAGSTAAGLTTEANAARIEASYGRIMASLQGQPASQWEAAADSMAAAESRVGVLTACSNMFSRDSAAPLPKNPNGPEGMSMLRLKSFVESGGASRSSSQRSGAASAKRLLPVVALAPAKQPRASKSRSLGEHVATSRATCIASHSQSLLLLEARPCAPAVGLLHQAAQLQPPVAESQVHLGDLAKWGLAPPPP